MAVDIIKYFTSPHQTAVRHPPPLYNCTQPPAVTTHEWKYIDNCSQHKRKEFYKGANKKIHGNFHTFWLLAHTVSQPVAGHSLIGSFNDLCKPNRPLVKILQASAQQGDDTNRHQILPRNFVDTFSILSWVSFSQFSQFSAPIKIKLTFLAVCRFYWWW